MAAPQRPDLGLSHVALLVQDVEASIAFYERFAGLELVHRRDTRRGPVVWLSDMARPFAIVLIETNEVEGRLEGWAHLGVGCASRAEVDRLCAIARSEGCLSEGPEDAGHPVGYTALLRDPDGHNLELSFGQEVGIAVDDARRQPTCQEPTRTKSTRSKSAGAKRSANRPSVLSPTPGTKSSHSAKLS